MDIVTAGGRQFEFEEERGTILYNSEPVEIDIQNVGPNYFHVIHKNQSYKVEVLSINRPEKTLRLKVNSNQYDVALSDQYDRLLQKLGLDKALSSQVAELKAPMPGLVLQILAQEGQQVSKGDNLLILEAMKMENMIKSPVDGIIKGLKIKAGDKVEKNQTLILF
jgi:biotin carboxyl carrier protein